MRRAVLLLFRYGILFAVLTLALVGVFSVVTPDKKVTAPEIASMVKQQEGETNFPNDAGNSFVLAYVSEFMTITPDNKKDRSAALARFAPTVDTTVLNNVESNEITQGPFVTRVKDNSDSDATYTVLTKTTALGWVNVNVPIFYDAATDSFAVVGGPSLMPLNATVGNVLVDDSKLGERDDKAKDAVASVLRPFFEAWARGDVDALKAFTIPGTTHPRAYAGFNDEYSVEDVDSVEVVTGDAGTFATVTVTWSRVGTDEKNPITWESHYLVSLTSVSGAWKITDITTESHFNSTNTAQSGR